MSRKQSFTDSDGDIYTVQSATGGKNIVLTYQNSEESGEDLFIFKAEDAQYLAQMILEAAKETRKTVQLLSEAKELKAA